MDAIAPITRIVLRVAAGALIGAGYVDRDAIPLFMDPALVGAIVWGVTEGWYAIAKRMGWAT